MLKVNTVLMAACFLFMGWSPVVDASEYCYQYSLYSTKAFVNPKGYQRVLDDFSTADKAKHRTYFDATEEGISLSKGMYSGQWSPQFVNGFMYGMCLNRAASK